jgi:DNA-directed RNA polymerase subunit RPC12/RpoP
VAYKDQYKCNNCGHVWRTRKKEGGPPSCPSCSSRSFYNNSKRKRRNTPSITEAIDNINKRTWHHIILLFIWPLGGNLVYELYHKYDIQFTKKITENKSSKRLIKILTNYYKKITTSITAQNILNMLIWLFAGMIVFRGIQWHNNLQYPILFILSGILVIPPTYRICKNKVNNKSIVITIQFLAWIILVSVAVGGASILF